MCVACRRELLRTQLLLLPAPCPQRYVCLRNYCVRVCVCLHCSRVYFVFNLQLPASVPAPHSCGGLCMNACVWTALVWPERAAHFMSHVLLLFHSLQRWCYMLYVMFIYDIVVLRLQRRVTGVCGCVK